MPTNQSTTLQCPNCGGKMTSEYVGEMMDKQVVCQFCHTAFDVPDNFHRVRKIRRKKGGLFGQQDIVEEEIHEFRSDKVSSPAGVYMPGASVNPTSSSAAGRYIMIVVAIILIAVMGIVVMVAVSVEESAPEPNVNVQQQSISESSSEVDRVEVPRIDEPDHRFKAHDGVVDKMIISADGSRLYTVRRREWALWDLESGERIVLDSFASGRAHHATFLNNGSTLMIQYDDTLNFFDTLNGQATHQFTLDQVNTDVTAASSDGSKYMSISASSDYTMQYFNLDDGSVSDPVDTLDFQPHVAAFSPDGRYVVIGGLESSFIVFDTIENRRTYTGRTNFTFVDEIAFSGSENVFVMENEGTVYFYIIEENGEAILQKTWNIDAFHSDPFIALSPDGSILATLGTSQSIILWDATQDEPTKTVELSLTENIAAPLIFSLDGSILWAADRTGVISEWMLEK